MLLLKLWLLTKGDDVEVDIEVVELAAVVAGEKENEGVADWGEAMPFLFSSLSNSMTLSSSSI